MTRPPPVEVARLPLAAGELETVGRVGHEDLLQGLRQRLVDHLDVDLVVAGETEPVDVGGEAGREHGVAVGQHANGRAEVDAARLPRKPGQRRKRIE